MVNLLGGFCFEFGKMPAFRSWNLVTVAFGKAINPNS
jgi:hypothetical protein